MNNTPAWIRKYWEKHPVEKCERWKEGNCNGRLTKEHAWIYAGKQIQEIWAIADICWYHHLGKGMNKNEHQKLTLLKATEEDLKKYPKKNWEYEKFRLKI